MHDDACSKVSTVLCSFELITELVRRAAEKQEVTKGCCLIEEPMQLALVHEHKERTEWSHC